MWDMGREERKRVGLLGREYMINNFSTQIMCESLSNGIDKCLKTYKKKKPFELYKIV